MNSRSSLERGASLKGELFDLTKILTLLASFGRHDPAVDTIHFKHQLHRNEMMPEGCGPSLRVAKGTVESESLFIGHDVIDRSGNHENAVVSNPGRKNAGVELSHPGRAAEDFVVFFVGEDPRDFLGRILAGIGNPLERTLENSRRTRLIEPRGGWCHR